MSLAELIPFRRQPGLNLDLGPDFEQQCIDALNEPAPTPLEMLRDGMAGVMETLRDQDKRHDEDVADLNRQLTKAREAKAANLSEIARIERALEQLRDEPEKPRRKARAA